VTRKAYGLVAAKIWLTSIVNLFGLFLAELSNTFWHSSDLWSFRWFLTTKMIRDSFYTTNKVSIFAKACLVIFRQLSRITILIQFINKKRFTESVIKVIFNMRLAS